MGTKTISLEVSAYELLKAQKNPDESFSDEVRRLLGRKTPSLRSFLALFPAGDSEDLARAMSEVREEDLREERRRQASGKGQHGHRD